MSYSLILNIPHSSTNLGGYLQQLFYPRPDRTQNVLLDFPLQEKRKIIAEYELLLMTDWYTDELFNHNLCPALIADVSRLICDTERFEDDEQEAMSKIGMGVCYTHGFDRQLLKDVPSWHRRSVVQNIYQPYHKRLENMVSDALEKTGNALILDCHSFYPIKLPYEINSESNSRPDICIGTDSFHTPTALTDFSLLFFKSLGYEVNINKPFSGSITPIKYYQKDKRVCSVMIELNRRLYLEKFSNRKNKSFETLKKQLCEYEKQLIKNNFTKGDRNNV